MTGSLNPVLGSVISIAKGKKHETAESPSSTAKRVIGIDDLRNDDLIRYTHDLNGVEATLDDVLIAWDGANAGTIGFGKSGYIGSTIARLRVKADIRIFTPFLGLYLKSKFDYLRQTATGATIPHINRSALEKISLPAVEFDDQIRIAHLLGKVEGLIAQRKQHLQQLDDLLKSVFLEMFGDPVRNEKGWDRLPLEKLGSLNRGVSKHRPRNAPELLGGKYPLIQTGEVSNAGTYITTFSQTYSDIGFAQSKLWPSGTLCITIAANIAQTGILTFDACFPDSVVAFSAFENEAHVLYVHGLFWFFQKILEKNAPAAAQKNINLEILRGMGVPKPPIELQAQFASVVEKIESIASRYRQSLTDLEALYGALSQQAFKGGLDLSRVPMPGIQAEEEKTVAADSLHPSVEQGLAIHLPDTDNLLAALESPEAREDLISKWLGAYCSQLGSMPFSVQHFMELAQIRVMELHPDTDFELGTSDYEHIKTWVFKALDSGSLVQSFDNENNQIKLLNRSGEWGSW